MLRIHLILINLILILIDDPGSAMEKMDPDPDLGHFFKFTEFFLTKQNYQIFFAYLLKLNEPLTKSGNFFQ